MKTIVHGTANPNGHGLILWTEHLGKYRVLSEPDMEDVRGETFFSYAAARHYFNERVAFWAAQPNVDPVDLPHYVRSPGTGQPSPASNWR